MQLELHPDLLVSEPFLGGSMAAGLVVVAAAPVAAGVLGYQGYKFYKNRKSS